IDPPEDRARPSPGRALLWSAVLLSLAALTRPDGLLVAASAGAFLLLRVLRGRLRWTALLAWAALLLVPYAIYFAWRFRYYGHFFPNSFYLKRPGLALLPEGLGYLGYATTRLWLPCLAAPWIALAIRRRGPGLPAEALGLGATLVVPYLAYTALAGGD